MELRDYLLIIRRSWLMIVSITLIVAIAVAVWSVTQPVKYDSEGTVVVNKPDTVPQRAASYFEYDKYYSIQASSLFADTLTAWLSSASTSQEIYQKAGLPVPNESVRKLGKIFKPRRLPPATIDITVTDRDKDKSLKLVQASIDVLKQKTDDQNKGDDPDNHFTIISGSIITEENKQDVVLNTILGLIGGLIIALIISFLGEYIRKAE